MIWRGALAAVVPVAFGLAVLALVWFPLQIPHASTWASLWSVGHDAVVGGLLVAGAVTLVGVLRKRAWVIELPLVYFAVCMASVLPLVLVPTLGLPYARMQWVTLATFAGVYLTSYAVSRREPLAGAGIMIALCSWAVVSAARRLGTAFVSGALSHDAVDVMGHTNSRAGFELVVALLLLGMLAEAGRTWRCAGIAVLALLLVSLGLSLSRGAWLGLIAGGAVMAGRRWGWRKAAAGAGVAGVLLLALPGPMGERARTIVDSGFETNLFRLNAWKEALRVIGENPWGGAGYDTLWFAMLSSLGSDVPALAGRHVHNLPLQTWAETGVLGLASLAGVVAVMFRRAWHLHDGHRPWVTPVGRGIALALVGVIVHGLVDCTWRDYGQQVAFWALAGWLFAVGDGGGGES